jgi:hypothetical protein
MVAFPTDIRPSASEFGQLANTRVFESPFSRSIQTSELPGTIWVARLVFENLKADEHRRLAAFLTTLHGAAGRFDLWDHRAEFPRGVATGSPQVNGGGQTGTSLATKGWTASVTGILKAGDMISFASELHMVTADANSNGSGNATLAIEPAIRVSPANNAAITTVRASCPFMLVGDDQASWRTRPGLLASFVLEAREAVP